MKKSALTALCLASLCLNSTSVAAFWIGDVALNPFIGFDAGVRHHNFDTDYGRELFRRNYPDTNFYIATQICEYWGLEVGYENSYRQNKNQFYFGNDPTLGFVPGADLNRLYLSDAFVNGWHLDLLGFWPICRKLGTELTGTIGVAWLKAHFQTTMIAEAIGNSEGTLGSTAYWQSGSTTLLRGGIGIRQMLGCHLGARLQIIWENTSNMSASVEVPELQAFSMPGIYQVNSNNTFVATLGFFFQLD